MLLAAMVAAMGPPREECISSTRLPEARLGPSGLYYQEPPQCKLVPAGSPCVRTIVIDHKTYGLTEENGILWVVCEPKK